MEVYVGGKSSSGRVLSPSEGSKTEMSCSSMDSSIDYSISNLMIETYVMYEPENWLEDFRWWRQ